MSTPTSATPSSFVSLAQIAQRLSASRRSARRWLERAGIRAYILGSGKNGAVRFGAEEVELWLKSRKEGG